MHCTYITCTTEMQNLKNSTAIIHFKRYKIDNSRHATDLYFLKCYTLVNINLNLISVICTKIQLWKERRLLSHTCKCYLNIRIVK